MTSNRLTFSVVASVTAFALAMSVGTHKVSAQEAPIQLTVGDTTTLILDGKPSTGYTWALEEPTPEARQLVSVDVKGYMPNKLAPERPLLGAAQKFQVFVTGLAPGKLTLAFEYVRGGTPTPAWRREFAIEVLDDAGKVPAADGPPDLPDDARDPTSDPIEDTPKDMFADPDGD